ncbi:hypothetical protein HYO65_gp102 [Tenacibaculum phage PTm1]|uniref:Uncharacterized protein n=2 Tax=Shirahamavirus PTm1 TaxID=2846435 RepID=A0A5S9HXF2_9CAUD|nr:hypothetical protein HYO65_gp102 [Tenacibaculum phage PTm1]BBI90494.1 hypothetical protein [Tenacibaculum phage PTm1]BBI90802.1 hypothetical protein [Tenacibaculum phage PTm5]
MIDKFGKDVPFFIFKKDTPRKDTPKEQIEGTPFNEVVTTSVESIRKANLTNHIVQIGDSKEGGFVTADNGTEVIVKLKNGLLRRINKSYLHYQKVWYTKKNYKRLWFKYISNQELPYNEPKLQTKGNPFKEYKELLSRFDKDYIMTDDPRVRKYQEQIHDQMNVLWNKLTPKQKQKLS